MVLTRKIRPEAFNYWVFLTSALFLLATAIFSLIWFQKQKNASYLISHTYQVKLKIEKCFGLLLEAESSQRGYLIGKDSIFLDHLRHAESMLFSNMKQLDSLVADNEVQIINLNKLENLASLRLTRLHDVLDSVEHFKKITINYASPGRVIMDSVHNQIKIMESEEDTLLVKRTLLKHKQDNYVSFFIILFSALAFTILIGSFLKIRNENMLRLKAQFDVDLLEKLVNERTAEIKNMNNLLKDQNESLERKNADLTSFTYIASHDLKEPLRKINMFIGRISDQNSNDPNDRREEYFNKISLQAKRMQHLIESVLQYAQADDETLGFEEANLNTTIQSALENLSLVIAEKKAIIKIQPLPTLFCVPSQLEQVFTNLIDNALKYAKPGIPPSLQINAEQLSIPAAAGENPSTGWKIDFADQGIGFDEAYKSKIFEIFQRLHVDEQYSGTGIGLAICKRIIGKHRGTISVQSTVGKGSVFSILLPSPK
jgi:signal transduction histidine kinase